jgi:hypothetical protein
MIRSVTIRRGFVGSRQAGAAHCILVYNHNMLIFFEPSRLCGKDRAQETI